MINQITVDVDVPNMLAGAAIALAVTGQVHWLIGVFGCFLPVSLKIPGMPYCRITYETGRGWVIDKGRY